ncbi:Protein CBG18899 [Caenorhabditis briggsae]|uniref:Protein CBG18899 n=1 Tax=Caenorhabditis briggsae TaxID=6238 RepID=A8XUB4_CAEBR|nr:Protein CBG18899 [Caenorhabditis briggsae]CAP36239.2 Protein CBG18899 [Caenorhabditis briggsae]
MPPGLCYLLIFLKLNHVSGCVWPEVDALFIMDSTPQVTSFQHRAEVDFLRQVMSTMKMSSSKVAMAQFTPWSRVEWSLSNATYPESRIQEAPYCPCELENCQSTSVNSLTRSTMSSSNRKGVPDVILVISNSYQPLVEVLPNEPLISPSSPLHVFYIVIGSNMHVSRFEPSAHTVGIKVTDFEHLPHLVGPLCQSVNGYIKGTSTTRFGPLCWIIIGAILLFALIPVALLLYAIYNYNEESEFPNHRIHEILLFRSPLATSNIRIRTSSSETERVLYISTSFGDAETNSKRREACRRDEKTTGYDSVSVRSTAGYGLSTRLKNTDTSSVYSTTSSPSRTSFRKGKNLSKRSDRRDSGIESPRSPREVEVQVTPISTSRDNSKEEGEEDNQSSGTSESILSSGSDITDSTETDLEELNRRTHLPRDHPARKLPPIDLMFLVDTSSSIGINNFDIQKNFICEILKDVDVAPGRSRISMVQYAQDPSVVFGFDQYYSYESVRRGVMRLSYTGGATMLSKALAFAGGIMYHEQNLKKTTKRHQFLPTPKHDRLQVLCLVSDGYSDDSADKESVNLHDRLHVKIFAVVTRSFNKDKLVPITRFDGSVFTVHQRESVAIWLWRQQRIWAEHYSAFIEKEKKRAERSARR